MERYCKVIANSFDYGGYRCLKIAQTGRDARGENLWAVPQLIFYNDGKIKFLPGILYTQGGIDSVSDRVHAG